MGRALLVGRLAVRDLRRRPVESVLLLVAITAATSVLALGLVLRGVTDDPYGRTRAATAGPDVVASVGPDMVWTSDTSDDVYLVPANLAGLEALTDAPEVADHSGPYPAVTSAVEVDGVSADVWVEGRDPGEASVDQPEVVRGEWVEDGGVVVEAAFADVLDVGPGDEVELGGRPYQVVGVAVTSATGPYTDVCLGGVACPDAVPHDVQFEWHATPPSEVPAGPPVAPEHVPLPPDDPGLVWLTEADTRALASSADHLSFVMNLKLTSPAEAPAFVAAHAPTSASSPFLRSWQDLRDSYGGLVREQREALVTGAWLLAVLAVASAAVLVGSRIADQIRRVGVLKAAGGTPDLVAVVLLAEYTIVALLAAAAGLAVGWLASPVLADPGAGLLGSAGAPSLTPSAVVLVAGLALGVAVLASFVPAIRAASTSTVQALADRARQPRRTRWLIALSARLPVPLLLGLRVAARRPRRVLLGVASIAVTVTGIVAVLAARAQIDADWDGASALDPQADRLNQVLMVITVTLVALAAINAVFITWATALDARHTSALARALGATPAEVGAGIAAAQVLPALAGALLGIPGGLALWAALSNDEAASPPLGQLLAVTPVTVLIVAGLTSVPARFAARRPAAEILQSELA